jgi:hypothetical protein
LENLGVKIMGNKPMNQLTDTIDAPIVEPESRVEQMSEAEKPNGALIALTSLRGDVHSRLLENQDYRTLVALDRAILEITGEKPAAPMPWDIPAQPQPRQKPNAAEANFDGLSQADAAQVLLNQVMHEPVPIARLVSALNAHGIAVGGANPNINLSSVLSKDGRFRSVRFKDRACWWIKGRPFPGELDAH